MNYYTFHLFWCSQRGTRDINSKTVTKTCQWAINLVLLLCINSTPISPCCPGKWDKRCVLGNENYTPTFSASSNAQNRKDYSSPRRHSLNTLLPDILQPLSLGFAIKYILLYAFQYTNKINMGWKVEHSIEILRWKRCWRENNHFSTSIPSLTPWTIPKQLFWTRKSIIWHVNFGIYFC